jgi:hypothetical protein
MPSVGGANVGINTSNGPDTRVPVLSTVDGTGAPTVTLTANNQSLPGALIPTSQSAAFSRLIDADPVQMPYRTRPQAVILAGDSITLADTSLSPITYPNSEYGLWAINLTPLTNLTSSFVSKSAATAECALGDTIQMSFDGVKYMTVNVAGEGYGAPVDVSAGGVFRLVSGGGSKGVIVWIRGDATKPGNVSDTVTLTGTTIQRISTQFCSIWAPVLMRIGTAHLNVINFGQAGDGTVGLLSRFGQIVTACTANPGALVLLNIGVNNIGGATQISDIKSMIQQANAAGAFVVLATTTPYYSATTAAASQYANLVDRQLDFRFDPTLKVDVVDLSSPLLDPAVQTGATILPAAYFPSSDVHPHVTGAVAAQAVLLPILQRILPSFLRNKLCSAQNVYDATNATRGNIIGTASQFIGTAGTLNGGGTTVTATGTLGTGWADAKLTDAVGATLAFTAPQDASPVARTDGNYGNWQRIVLAAGATGAFSRQLSRTITGLSAGMRVRAGITFRFTNASRMNLFDAYLQINTSGTARFAHIVNFGVKIQDAAGVGVISDSGAYYAVSPVILLPSTMTTVSFGVLYGCAVNGGVTLDIQDAFVEIFN